MVGSWSLEFGALVREKNEKIYGIKISQQITIL